jgi:menaquinone-9 beta-reductase
MIRRQFYDVVIAGAGPAGTHTALRLARGGFRVALIDARSFPRKKPCGEFLSPACLPILEELGLLEGLFAVGANRVRGMHLSTATHQTQGDYLPLGPFAASHGAGLGIRREVLDDLAMQAAQQAPNIDVLLSTRVTAVTRTEERAIGVMISHEGGEARHLAARFVVGADGPKRRVALYPGWSLPQTGRERFAIVARFTGVPDTDHAALHVLGRDYFAACPIDNGIFTANLVVDRAELAKGSAGLEEVFFAKLSAAPAMRARLEHAELCEPMMACGPLGARVARVTGPGAALVGDAAGFVDPLTGEGLYFAMQGARYLSAALTEALLAPDREEAALARYAKSRRGDFGPRYGLARLLQSGLGRPGVPEKVIGLLERFPLLCDLMLGLTGDYLPPRGLFSPRVWHSLLTRPRPGRTIAS